MNAKQITAVAEWLLSSDAMGEGGQEIDAWLADRGVEGFAEVVSAEVARTISGVAETMGWVENDGKLEDGFPIAEQMVADIFTIAKSEFMHGFFLGLEVGRRTSVADSIDAAIRFLPGDDA